MVQREVPDLELLGADRAPAPPSRQRRISSKSRARRPRDDQRQHLRLDQPPGRHHVGRADVARRRRRRRRAGRRDAPRCAARRNVPRPTSREIRPSASSTASAWRTIVRVTPSSAASWRSVGSRPPGANAAAAAAREDQLGELVAVGRARIWAGGHRHAVSLTPPDAAVSCNQSYQYGDQSHLRSLDAIAVAGGLTIGASAGCSGSNQSDKSRPKGRPRYAGTTVREEGDRLVRLATRDHTGRPAAARARAQRLRRRRRRRPATSACRTLAAVLAGGAGGARSSSGAPRSATGASSAEAEFGPAVPVPEPDPLPRRQLPRARARGRPPADEVAGDVRARRRLGRRAVRRARQAGRSARASTTRASSASSSARGGRYIPAERRARGDRRLRGREGRHRPRVAARREPVDARARTSTASMPIGPEVVTADEVDVSDVAARRRGSTARSCSRRAPRR